MELAVTQGVQQSGSLRRPVTPLPAETEMAFKQARDRTIQQEKVAGAKDLTTLREANPLTGMTFRVKRTSEDLEIA